MYHKIKTRAHKKKKAFQGSHATDTQIGEKVVKTVKARGGTAKNRVVKADVANVLVDGKNLQCKIAKVDENPASRDLTRRNIITKGAVLDVKTPSGDSIKAKVTSRPGQDGTVNAVKA